MYKTRNAMKKVQSNGYFAIPGRWMMLFHIGLLMATSAGAATIWNGPTITFTQVSGSGAVDQLTADVRITRGVTQGIYNAASENGYTHDFSPADTAWAFGELADYASLSYTTWEQMFGGSSGGGPPSTVGKNCVVHLISDDIYLSLQFTSWPSRGAGGFSYVRSTAPGPLLPVITVQPQSQTVLTNTTVTFSVTASNATSFQWQTNMVDLPGATNASLTLSNVVLGDAATYRVVVGNASSSVISSNAVLLVLTILPPVIITQPQSQTVLTNSSVTFSVTASNAASFQWQTNTVDLPGATNASLTLSNVVIGDSGAYRVVVTNLSGSATSSVAVLIVGYPVSITQQPANVDVSAGTLVTLQVGATGSPTPQYQWFLNNLRLPGQTTDTLALGAATTNLEGTYAVVVSNAFGPQMSSNAVLTVEPLASIIKEQLTVTISPAGSGTVVPNLNGRSLIVAHSYTVKAVAGRGQVFTNWSGIAQSDNQSLTFVMPSISNATLTANFIPSPFMNDGVAGVYSGLFWDTNNLSNETAGYFAATVAGNGLITGLVKSAGVSTPFATNLYADGSATLRLKRPNLSSLVLTLQVDLSGLKILTGTVSDTNNTFNAPFTAYRAGFSASHRAANYDGYYTWAMPGAPGNAPAGYSYGTATVSAAGGVHLSIFLSDGATAIAAGSLSTNGQMPLYASLYGGKGSLLSWLSFTNSSNSLSTNGAFWFKDMVIRGSYANGFTLTNLFLWLGAYTAEGNGANALNSASVSVQLSDADLTNSIAEPIALNPNGIGGSFTNIVVTISDSAGVFTGLNAGMFTGLFKEPVSGKTIRFNGAVLHPLPAGYGFFTSGDLSGAVFIQPQ
jgi:hypothetical protein